MLKMGLLWRNGLRMFTITRCRRHFVMATLLLVVTLVFITNFIVSSSTVLNLSAYLRHIHFDTRVFADSSGDSAMSSESDAGNEVYHQRLRQATDACFRHKLGGVHRIMSDKSGNLANCIVPKVGCTYWINIFRYLNNETEGKSYESPFDIPRWITHYGRKSKEMAMRRNDTGPAALADTLRFMFVREPYSRLWSAWIDKFWLPDFWIWAQVYKIGKRENDTEPCFFTNASFVDFLKFVTQDSYLKNPAAMNEHWAPYKYLCDPCMFHPHVIGKMETFSHDSRFILDSVNLTWVLNPPKVASTQVAKQTDKYTDHSLREMKLLTEYNVLVAKKNQQGVNFKGAQQCFSVKDLYRRIWKTFQFNGHLPASVDFPSSYLSQTNYSRESFQRITEETYLSWKERSKDVQAQQKKDFMLNAYKEVPTELMEKLQSLYNIDFEMYNYEKRPKELYWYR